MKLNTSNITVTIHCAVCKQKTTAYAYSVDIPGMGIAIWLRMPSNWTVLLPIINVDSLHCRCPKHGFKK